LISLPNPSQREAEDPCAVRFPWETWHFAIVFETEL
jgi:hypothetical protein